MPYALREFACSGCGQPVSKRAPSGTEHLCVPCSVERSADTIRQLHYHSGPAWDAWLARIHALTGCPLAHMTPADLARASAALAAEDGIPRSPSPVT